MSTTSTLELTEQPPCRFRLEPRGDMRVPGVVFASRELLDNAGDAVQQVKRLRCVGSLLP